MRGVGDEPAQVLLRLLQPLLGGDAGRERRLDALEHDVEGAGQATDLGGLIGAGHALVEVARGDGLGRGLHVFERAQTEADEPPAAGQGQDQRAGGHGELGQEERVQGAGLVDEGLSHDGEVTSCCSFTARTRKAGPLGSIEQVVK